MLETPPGGPLDDDDIEILEVVGVDENEAPPEEASDEVELVFDDEPRSPAPDVADRERFQRLAADFDNLKKRVDREREDFSRIATRDLVSRLLVVLDNF